MTGGGGFLLYLQMHDDPDRHPRRAARLRPGHGAARARGLHAGPDDRFDDVRRIRRPTRQGHSHRHVRRRSDPMTTPAATRQRAIEISDLTKSFGSVRALDGLDLTVARRRGARLPRPQRRGQVDDHPDPARPGQRRRRHRRGCSAATRGPTPSTLHREIAYVPGDVTLWPSLTGGETIDLLARMRGGIDETAPRRAHRTVRPRPAPRRPAPTRRATGRRSRWSRPSRRTPGCCCSTSPAAAWIR